MKRANIELTEQDHKKAKITAIEQNITLKDYLRIIIETHLRKEETEV